MQFRRGVLRELNWFLNNFDWSTFIIFSLKLRVREEIDIKIVRTCCYKKEMIIGKC